MARAAVLAIHADVRVGANFKPGVTASARRTCGTERDIAVPAPSSP